MSVKWYKKYLYPAIITGCCVIAAAVISGLFGRSNGNLKGPPPNDTLACDSSQIEISGQYNYLSDYQLRCNIDKLLSLDSIAAATKLVKYLNSEAGREEEYESIVNFCIQNGRLDEAGQITRFLHDESLKENIMTKIALEKQ